MYKHAVDNNGNKYHPSNCYRELDWQILLDDTLPSWLTAVGTVTAQPNMTASQGGINLATTAVANNEAYFRLNFDVLVKRFAAIDIMVDGLRFSKDYTNIFNFQLGIDSSNLNSGIFISHAANADDSLSVTKGVIRNASGVLAKELDRKIITNQTELDYTNKSLMLRLLPHEQAGEFYEDGAFIDRFESGTTEKYVVESVVRPQILIKTIVSEVSSLTLQRLRIGFWT